MNIKVRSLFYGAVAFIIQYSAPLILAQSSFVNLGFESANVAPLPLGQLGGSVSIINGFPGWTGYVGTNQTSTVLHNQEYLDTASISILGPTYTAGPILGGQYTAFLQAGHDPNSGNVFDRISSTLAQSGMIPVGSQSIQITTDVNATSLQVVFQGSLVPMFAYEQGANYRIFAGNISSFAGSFSELRISALPVPFYNGFNRIYLDNIQFSTQSIPEPSTFALTGIGALLFAVFYRRNARRK